MPWSTQRGNERQKPQSCRRVSADMPAADLGQAKNFYASCSAVSSQSFRQGNVAFCEDTEHNAFALWKMTNTHDNS